MNALEWTSLSSFIGCTYLKQAKADDESGHLEVILFVVPVGPGAVERRPPGRKPWLWAYCQPIGFIRAQGM